MVDSDRLLVHVHAAADVVVVVVVVVAGRAVGGGGAPVLRGHWRVGVQLVTAVFVACRLVGLLGSRQNQRGGAERLC